MPTSKRSVEDAIEAGALYCDQRNYRMAIAEYDAGLANQKVAILYDLRAIAYYRLGQYERALVDHTEAIELDKENANYWFNRGLTYFALTRLVEALEDFRRALIRDPEHLCAHIASGRVYAQKRDYPAAMRKYEKALELDPCNVVALNNRGCLRLTSSEHSLALADFDRAIMLDPSYPSPLEGRILVYDHHREYAKAKIDCIQLLQQQPVNVIAHQVLGRVYSYEEKFELAFLHFAKALFYSKKQYDFHLKSCELDLQKLFKHKDAYSLWSHGLLMLPTNEQIWSLYYVFKEEKMIFDQIKRAYLHSIHDKDNDSFEKVEIPRLMHLYKKLVQSRIEVRRAARLISQGQRHHEHLETFRFFSHLPTEIGVKIASHLHGETLTIKEAEAVAIQHFCKPITLKAKKRRH